MNRPADVITAKGAAEHNLKNIDVSIERNAITVITGVSGSGKSSLAFDTILAEANRRFFYTLSHYSRQFLDLGSRPAVRSVSGLSPAIALAQNETQPSRRATVGTLTDVSELIGVMLARFGVPHCPKHGLPTAATTVSEIVERVLADFINETIHICVSLAEEKKGIFAAELTKFHELGYSRAYIDGQTLSLNPLPHLAREEKHVIKLILDTVKIKAQGRDRLQRSIELALQYGAGYGEIFPALPLGDFDISRKASFSATAGCPKCGHSWPSLDSRYFSANSLGKCEECDGFGAVWEFSEEEEADSDNQVVEVSCESCQHTGLRADIQAIQLAGRTPHQLHKMALEDLLKFLHDLQTTERQHNPAFRRVHDEACGILERIVGVGLGYVSLSRRVRALSGGEAQRLKLAGILSESLRGILYVLDEPSQGLHPTEIMKVWQSLQKLKEDGNTVILVDHDETFMNLADWIIDLGPGGGAQGGRITAKFRPKEAAKFAKQSLTARHLASPPQVAVPRPAQGHNQELIILEKPRLNNLRMPQVRFLKHAINVVTGVSGAGKSSLVLRTLFQNVVNTIEAAGDEKKPRPIDLLYECSGLQGVDDLDEVILIDRRPVAKSSVSMPATYLDLFTDLRKFYADLPAAQVAGLTFRSFSLSVDEGRCENCKGRGEINLTMRFLADARIKCSVCQGKRYKQRVLDVTYDGLSLADVLELTLEETLAVFKNFRRIAERLRPACELGLGYLKLGQPSSSLSGGESQRLKIVPYLVKKHGKGTLLIVDEPTTGLHFEDVARLVASFQKLAAAGATLVIVEHSAQVIRASDWRVDLGPGAASDGGLVMYEGPTIWG